MACRDLRAILSAIIIGNAASKRLAGAGALVAL